MANQIDLHVYGRVSRPDRKDKDHEDKQDKSLAIQSQEFRDACTTLIPDLFKGHIGNIVGNYADEKSASRKRVRRPDFQRLLHDIDGGVVRVLLVLNLSRFARLHHIDAMELHIKLYRHNVTLVSIDDRKIISIDELLSFLEVAFKSNNDHEYARTVGKNTLRGSIASVKSGQAHCKDTPYGMQKLYVMDRGEEKLVPRGERISKSKDWGVYLVEGDKMEAKIVKWIFTTYAGEDTSPAFIARQLNNHADLVVRLGPTGKGWSEETVKYLLRNRHYNNRVFIGQKTNGEHYRTNATAVSIAKEVKTPNPLVVQSARGGCIIDDELWGKVQKKIQHNQATKRRAVTAENHEGHCLTGVLFCGHCKRSLYCFNPKNIRYQCKNRVSGCKCWSVAENEMLPFILKKIDRELLKQLDSKPNVSNEDQGYLSRLADIDARIKALNLSLKTARVESIPIITTAINDLHNERNKVSQGVSQVSQRERLQAAVERWEMLVEPLTIGIKTDNRGEDDPALDGLDIQDEIDRLFNITLARPSSVRNLLHSLDCKVECWFNPIPGSRSHVLDRGRLTCTIDGQITNNNNPGSLALAIASAMRGSMADCSPRSRNGRRCKKAMMYGG